MSEVNLPKIGLKFEQGKLSLHTQPFIINGEEQVAYLIWEKRTAG